jgi:hypothetical protein
MGGCLSLCLGGDDERPLLRASGPFPELKAHNEEKVEIISGLDTTQMKLSFFPRRLGTSIFFEVRFFEEINDEVDSLNSEVNEKKSNVFPPFPGWVTFSFMGLDASFPIIPIKVGEKIAFVLQFNQAINIEKIVIYGPPSHKQGTNVNFHLRRAIS